MHYSFHRRSMLALAALPLAGAAAHASDHEDHQDHGTHDPAHIPERTSRPADAMLRSSDMIGKKLRVIEPNSMVTMDYSTERVNVELDEAGLIKRVYIG